MPMPMRKCNQHACKRSEDGPFRRTIVCVAPLIDYLGVLVVGGVQEFRCVLHPRRSVLLQIEDLQLRYRGVAAVHVLALVHQGLGKFLGPVLFELLHLFKGALFLVGVRQRLGLLQLVVQVPGCRHSSGPLRACRRLAGSCSGRDGSASSGTGPHRLRPSGPATIFAAVLASCSRLTALQLTANMTRTMNKTDPKAM